MTKEKATIYIAIIGAISTVTVALIGLVSLYIGDKDNNQSTTAQGSHTNQAAMAAPSNKPQQVSQSASGNTIIQNLGTMQGTTIVTKSEPPRIPATFKEKISVSVDMAQSRWGRGSYYEAVKSDTGTVIKKSAEPRYNFSLPTFDIKIVNNTDETILLSELRFSDVVSIPDNSPELSWPPQINYFFPQRKLYFHNDGWGTALNATLTGTFTAFLGGKSPVKYTTEIKVGDIKESTAVNMDKIIRKAFNITTISESENIVFSGQLSYQYIDHAGTVVSEKERVDIEIINSMPLAGAAMGPSYLYSMKFKTQDTGYIIRTNISQSLKPGEADRFLVVLGAEQSSIHEFKLDLIYNNSENISLGKFNLEYYLPRSQAHNLCNDNILKQQTIGRCEPQEDMIGWWKEGDIQ